MSTTAQKIRVLLIEDDPDDALLIQEALTQTEAVLAPFELVRAGCLSAGLACLATERVDAVLLDLHLPDSQGIGTSLRLRQQAPHVPFIVLTGLDDNVVALRVVQAGAQDYLNKKQITSGLLVRSLHYAIERHRLLSNLESVNAELQTANVRLEALATLDGLTGLKNHRAFQERLEDEFKRSVRYRLPLSLVLLDVDQFKVYNDTFGHPAGDDVLKTVAFLLQTGARETDFVARYGGEEFAVILPSTDNPGALVVAERLRDAVGTARWPHRQVSVSFGAATHASFLQSRAELIALADQALYRSKDRGRDRRSRVG